MFSATPKLLLILAVAFTFVISGYSQTAADNTPLDKPREHDDYPRSIRDSLEKMRISKEKEDYKEMIERGEQAAKIAAELDNALATNGRLTEKEKAQLASVEKLVKKIRSDLGGGDDEDVDDMTKGASLNIADAVKKLKNSTEELFKELKKTSRFTISASAIYCSNSVLRLAKFVRFAQ